MLIDAGKRVEDGERLERGWSQQIIITISEEMMLQELHTLLCIWPKFTPSSSSNGGSPSYPSVPNAASQPVLNPPASPMRPLTPAGPAKPELKPLAP